MFLPPDFSSAVVQFSIPTLFDSMRKCKWRYRRNLSDRRSVNKKIKMFLCCTHTLEVLKELLFEVFHPPHAWCHFEIIQKKFANVGNVWSIGCSISLNKETLPVVCWWSNQLFALVHSSNLASVDRSDLNVGHKNLSNRFKKFYLSKILTQNQRKSKTAKLRVLDSQKSIGKVPRFLKKDAQKTIKSYKWKQTKKNEKNASFFAHKPKTFKTEMKTKRRRSELEAENFWSKVAFFTLLPCLLLFRLSSS